MGIAATARLNKEVEKMSGLYQSIKTNEKEVVKFQELCTQLEETTKKTTSGFEQYGENFDLLLNAKKNLDILIEQLNSYLNIEEKINELRNYITEPSEIMRVLLLPILRYTKNLNLLKS
jgi:hypothetical protein